jgi:hypothetical protein
LLQLVRVAAWRVHLSQEGNNFKNQESFLDVFFIFSIGPLVRERVADDDAEFHVLPCPSDRFLDLLTRCVQAPALAQSLGSYTRLSLRERGRWLSKIVSETLHIDPARNNAFRVFYI